MQMRYRVAQLETRQEAAAGTGTKKIPYRNVFSLQSSKIQDHKAEHGREREFRARVQGSTAGGVDE